MFGGDPRLPLGRYLHPEGVPLGPQRVVGRTPILPDRGITLSRSR